jgi:hypothetical protein
MVMKTIRSNINSYVTFILACIATILVTNNTCRAGDNAIANDLNKYPAFYGSTHSAPVMKGVNSSAIDIMCGGDSITLTYPGYTNTGVVEWQESGDTLNWVNIPEVFGPQYRFLPNETKFYRGVLKTSDSLYYSSVTRVQMPPVANAGLDKVAGGNSVILLGNMVDGSLGEWTVLEGDSCLIADPANNYSLIGGKYNIDYVLQWRLWNACGESLDTVIVRFEELNVKLNFIVVDITDSLYSDSTQIANGYLKIKFSDPSISPADSVVLIGMRDTLSFFQKATSFYFEDSIYHFTTIQASFEDIFTSGTINIGDAINQGILEGDVSLKSARVGKSSGFPTRETLKEFAGNKDVFLLFTNIHNEEFQLKSATNQEGGERTLSFSIPTQKIVEAYNGGLKATLEDFRFELTPNFVSQFSLLPFNFRFGMDNAVLKCDYTLVFEATGAFSFQSQEKTIWRPMNQKKLFVVFVAGVPVVTILNTSVKGSYEINTEGAITITQKGSYTNNITAIIESSTLGLPQFKFNNRENSSSSVDIGHSINFGIYEKMLIGPEISFKLYDVVGPYINVPLKFEASLKRNILNGNWSGEASAGIFGYIGARAEIEKTRFYKAYTLFDYKYSIWGDALSLKYKIPRKLELLSGDKQSGTSGAQLSKPLIFKVSDSFGTGVPLVPVRIELESGNGTVQNSVILSDSKGQVKVYWTLGPNQINNLKAYVRDYSDINIINSPVSATANSSGVSPLCTNSDLSMAAIYTSTYVFPEVKGGKKPYKYSLNGVDYSTSIPLLYYTSPGTFPVQVRDDNQCSITRYITVTAVNPCANSNLSMDVVTLSNTIRISGKNGSAPYQYSLGSSDSFHSSDMFYNVSPGTHKVYIKDLNLCIAVKDVTIESETVAGIKAVYPHDGGQFVNPANILFSWQAANYHASQVYDISLKKAGAEYSLIAGNTGNTLFQHNGVLEYNSVYFWKIDVKVPGGNLLDSREFSFSTSSDISSQPDIPFLLQPANGSFTEAVVLLRWSGQQGDFRYDVFADDQNASRLVATNLTGSSYTLQNLQIGKTYYWKVRIKSLVTGQTSTSSVWSFRIYEKIDPFDISYLEYFFDTDPGIGNGISLPVSASPFVNLQAHISLQNISPGLHRLYFRAKDSEGKWSVVHSKPVLVTKDDHTGPIEQIEYFFDNPVVYGAGTSFSFSASNNVNLTRNVNLDQISPGLHRLYFRAKDSKGNWSLVHSKPVLVTQDDLTGPIDRIEYFYDNPVAAGAGNSLTFDPAKDVNLTRELNLSQVSPGLHRLYFRARNSQGYWSAVHSRPLLVNAQPAGLPDITRIEYYFNQDPGLNQAGTIPFTPSAHVEASANLPLTNLSSGQHTVVFRAKDSHGLWSLPRFLPFTLTDEALNLQLKAGWNIASSSVIPYPRSLLSVFQPLINDGKLRKVMDETGKTIENYGFFGGWQNDIGDMDSTRGYKVNLTAPATLSIVGIPVALPETILLKAGWNIIGYPALSPQSALNIMQPLISAGLLHKVMDEEGRTIEDFGQHGGWTNNIGDFTPGKGYKVLVSQNASITIDDVGTKSAAIIPEVIPSSRFKPAFTGNGTDHMNLHLVSLLQSGLKEGDEIGIFDGNLCVGSARLTLQPIWPKTASALQRRPMTAWNLHPTVLPQATLLP